MVNAQDPDSANSSIEEEVVRAWWTKWPTANIGLDCGRSGVVVIDSDLKEDGPKILSAMKLVSGGRRAWETRKHKTPGGGEHYIFEAPKDDHLGVVPTKSGTFGGPGIDTRARGGYILLPPSSLEKYGNKQYEVSNNLALAPIPKRILFEKDHQAFEGQSEAALAISSGDAIASGARNQTLHRIASKKLREGFNKEELLALMLAVNKSRCQPPLPELDVRRIVKSVTDSYVPKEDPTSVGKIEVLEGVWNDYDEAVSVSLQTFLEHDEPEIPWLMEGIFPTHSLNMVMGSPKSGKSTLVRYLALLVASGKGQFLDRKIVEGPVLYYSLQERKAHTKKFFTELLKEATYEKTPDIDFIFRLGRRGISAIKGLRERLLAKPYRLVVLDMASRFSNIRKLDDYSETSEFYDSLAELAEETGTCIVFLHHERKSGGDFDGAIGSQAIRGACYTTLKCSRAGKIFTVSSEQREGEDLEETSIKMVNKQLMLSTDNALGLALAKMQQQKAKK